VPPKQREAQTQSLGTNSHYLGVTVIFRDCDSSLIKRVSRFIPAYAGGMPTTFDTSSETQAPLQTVDRALEILLSFSEFRTSWGVLELAKEYGITKSTAQRLLAALATRGFLRADPQTRRYSLGPAVWRTAALWERSGGLAALADPYLFTLAQTSARTSLFSIADGTHVRCIAAVDGIAGPSRSHLFIGELYPAHAGATSRAHFAFMEPTERTAFLSGRPAASYSGLTQVDESALRALFDETVATGYAFSEGEYDAGTRALAVPVFVGPRSIGSLSLVEGKSVRYTDSLLDHLTELQKAADGLSDLLSARPPALPRRDWRLGTGAP
jgi:DNA-binding IclR family transcriptional regulator